MSARPPVGMASLLLAGLLFAGAASAGTMYRCDGNLVTDSPNGGKNCVAMGSRLKSSVFSAGSVDALLEAEPTAAGPAAAHRDGTAPYTRANGSIVVVPSASSKR